MNLPLHLIDKLDVLLQPYCPEPEDIEILAYYGMLIDRIIQSGRLDVMVDAVMIFSGIKEDDRAAVEYQPQPTTQVQFLEGLIVNNFLAYHRMARNI